MDFVVPEHSRMKQNLMGESCIRNWISKNYTQRHILYFQKYYIILKYWKYCGFLLQ